VFPSSNYLFKNSEYISVKKQQQWNKKVASLLPLHASKVIPNPLTFIHQSNTQVEFLLH
jgi:hypothetical protein